jgi:hypothetical protein
MSGFRLRNDVVRQTFLQNAAHTIQSQPRRRYATPYHSLIGNALVSGTVAGAVSAAVLAPLAKAEAVAI